MWAKIITIKRTKDLNYFSLCALNLFNTRVSQFELNYWNKWTFPQHSKLLRCTCITCMHSFETALITFMILHAHSLFCALILNDTGCCACWGFWACKSMRYEHRTISARFSRAWYWSEVEESDVRLKRLQFDVVVKTFFDWINALLVKKKRDVGQSKVDNPSPAPALTALNNLYAFIYLVI